MRERRALDSEQRSGRKRRSSSLGIEKGGLGVAVDAAACLSFVLDESRDTPVWNVECYSAIAVVGHHAPKRQTASGRSQGRHLALEYIGKYVAYRTRYVLAISLLS